VRKVVVWVSLSALVYSCFAPWAEVTTFDGESYLFGPMSSVSGGGQLVLLCAAAAAIGLFVRATRFAALSALTAAGLSALLGYQMPGNLLQLGYEAHATWGCFLAIVSALVLFVAVRGGTAGVGGDTIAPDCPPTTRRSPGSSYSASRSPRS
jgi:hypothetical protein